MFSGLLDDAMSVISAPYMIAKAAKPYLREGMDYLSDMMPERAEMKGYIPGEYDDYAIDAIGDGYNYLRGLLDDGPSQDYGQVSAGGPYPGMQAPPPPSGPYPGMQGERSSPIAALFQQSAPMPEANELRGEFAGTEYGYSPAASARPRPRLMSMIEEANAMAPRPSTGSQDLARNYSRDFPEYKALRDLSPYQNASTSYKTMQGRFRQPEGLLSGEMMPQGFEVEETVIQPIPARDPLDVGAYMRSSVRDRVKRKQDMDARMMAANNRIKTALSR